jgi:hypothetical protein
MVPFWFPALWIGATLWLLPHQPLVTLLGYHICCLLGCRSVAKPAVGRIPGYGWALLALMTAALPLVLRVRGLLPMAGAQTFLAAWPGGLPGYVAYTLTVNSVCEEVYWRHSLLLARPNWSPWAHGAAFGLHHFVANGLVFGWLAAPGAFLYTAVCGRLAIHFKDRTGGLLFPILGHSLLNALGFLWIWGALKTM